MQIHIRGQNNHVLDIDGSETVAEIKVSVTVVFIGRDKVDFTDCWCVCSGELPVKLYKCVVVCDINLKFHKCIQNLLDIAKKF